jgi:16S rRNA (adenine1518-N6/adenine1519-N6)-dimethyltransferase
VSGSTHRARKRFGQNFLVDPQVIDRIVAAIAPRAGETLVEIGPGHGALTEPLLAAGAHVIAIELDRDLAALLARRHAGAVNLELIQADALKVDLAALAPGPVRLVGNLPYNVSSPLLFHFAAHREAWSDATLMLQREVAARLVARAGDRACSRLSVMMALSTDSEQLFDVPPTAFDPAPKVTSSIVRLRPRRPEITSIERQQAFAAFVREAFSQRRKTLANNLRARLDRARIAALGFDPARRPQELGLEDFLRLFEAWESTRDEA